MQIFFKIYLGACQTADEGKNDKGIDANFGAITSTESESRAINSGDLLDSKNTLQKWNTRMEKNGNE